MSGIVYAASPEKTSELFRWTDKMASLITATGNHRQYAQKEYKAVSEQELIV
jgi:hypothetical protein